MLASILRLWGAFEDSGYIGDEEIHVPAAVSMAQYGVGGSQQWFNPPLSGIILYGTISVFGENPLGRRISNICFGVATILVLYLIGVRLYPDSAVALIAASLLTLDPFHIYLSRNTHMEIPVSFFFLLYLYFMLEFSEKQRTVLPLAGIAMGLTIATKAYYVFAIPLVALFVIHRAKQRGLLDRHLISGFTFNLMLLPFAIYLLSFIFWFGRGYTLLEFIQMKVDAIWTLQNLRIEQFTNWALLDAGGKPWEWFVKPLITGKQIYSDGANGRFMFLINNPPFRLLVIPAFLLLGVHALRKKSIHELVAPLLFCSCYILFLVIKRPIFSYSSLVVLPFAYLAVARAVVLLARQSLHEKRIYTVFLCCVMAWGFYIFPLASARMVPLSFYQPIISIAKISGKL